MTGVCQNDVVNFGYKTKKEVYDENKSLLQISSKRSASVLSCGRKQGILPV